MIRSVPSERVVASRSARWKHGTVKRIDCGFLLPAGGKVEAFLLRALSSVPEPFWACGPSSREQIRVLTEDVKNDPNVANSTSENPVTKFRQNPCK